MAVINQLDIRRGNASGSVVTTTYDIGASAENVLLSDGTSVETAITGGGSVKFEGFGHITSTTTQGADPVAVFTLYNNPTYTEVYDQVSDKAGIFIIKFDTNIDCTNLRLAPTSDQNSAKAVYKQGARMRANSLAQNAVGIFLRNNNTNGQCYELIGTYYTPYINTSGTLSLV